MRRRELLVGAAAFVTPVVAGCGGDDERGRSEDTTTPGTRATTPTEGMEVTTTGTASGRDTTATTRTTTTATVAATVRMVGFSFDPVRADVGVGRTVEWVNESGYAHDVTSAQFSDGAAAWNFTRTLGADESATYTFDAEGVYEYYCTIHGRENMCGVVLAGDVSHDGTLPCRDGGSGA